MPNKIQKILNRFDEKFPKLFSKINEKTDYQFHYLLERQDRQIKSFIKKEIEGLLEEIVPEPIKTNKTDITSLGFESGYEQCISDIKSKIA